ncbi:hypothetical protein B7R25_10975 [Subtercola boreus]|uniref:Uncharacterized protein n=1 Tax=Subtercola boreus TaxID=120213 RepID=A0A3E0WBJ8_9MICO|nr:hypothetical protein B7R23_10860 [Subtercola boreus]RFA26353.1 hypothetical protein B7R25_10975 [Subtercola boreus]
MSVVLASLRTTRVHEYHQPDPPDSDLETEVAELQARGVTFAGDISDRVWGRIVPFTGTEGINLQFYTPPTN